MNAEEFADQLRELESARHSLMMVAGALEKHLLSVEDAETTNCENCGYRIDALRETAEKGQPATCERCNQQPATVKHTRLWVCDGCHDALIAAPQSDVDPATLALSAKPPSTEAAEKGEFACSTCGALGDATHTMPWVCRECRASLESGSPSCTEARLRTLGNKVRDIETGLGGLTVDRDRIEARLVKLETRLGELDETEKAYDELYTAERDKRREQIAEHAKRLTSLEANPCEYTDRPHIAGVSEAPDSDGAAPAGVSPEEHAAMRGSLDQSDVAELARALRHMHDAHKGYPPTPLQATALLQAEELLTKWDAK